MQSVIARSDALTPADPKRTEAHRSSGRGAYIRVCTRRGSETPISTPAIANPTTRMAASAHRLNGGGLRSHVRARVILSTSAGVTKRTVSALLANRTHHVGQ